ncbi:MAG: response regulator [Candidatus Paceibacterota bacterium]|jgi:DNA-binding response OmpR family regulator
MEDKKIHLLVVEDDEFLVKMYESGLTKEGFDVTTAGNGEEGLQKAGEIKPDLILLDLIMPKMDGFTCLEKLKEDNAIKRIPVVILSNLGQDSDIKRGMEMGAEGYLIKTDFTVKQVAEKVRKILGIN